MLLSIRPPGRTLLGLRFPGALDARTREPRCLS
jgi:hypothetical protein